MWSFGKNFARNVVILSVDNGSSSHTDNQLVLGEGLTDAINARTGAAEKKLVLKTKFCLSLHNNGNEGYLYINKTEICNFKANDNISWYKFCLGSMSKIFTKDEQSEISFNSTVYNFSVDHSSVKKVDIHNIHKYLMVKNNIK